MRGANISRKPVHEVSRNVALTDPKVMSGNKRETIDILANIENDILSYTDFDPA